MVSRRALRPFQVRLQVEDAMVTVVVSGVLDTQAISVALSELLTVWGLTKAVTVDLCAVSELATDGCLSPFLDEMRSRCERTGCRLLVIATHPRVLHLLNSWGTGRAAV